MTENLQNLISQAQECESKKDWDGAIRCWSQVIDWPEDQISEEDRAKAFNNRGNAFTGKGELDLAIRDYDKAIKLKPKNAKTLNNRGFAYAKKGELDLAIRDYGDAINLEDDYVQARINRSAAFIDKGEFDLAIRDLDHAIKREHDNADAFNNRGNAFAKKGELDSAIRDYDHAIKLKRNYAKALNNRGIAFTKKGELERAISDFDDAIRIKPNLADAHNNRAISLARIHARETGEKYKKEHEEQLRQIKESHEQALRQVTDPVEIIKSYQDRGDKYVKQIKGINCKIMSFNLLLSVILIGGFSAIAIKLYNAWQRLAFGLSDCDIPNCLAHSIVISTDRGEVSFAGLFAIAPLTLVLFTACFPLIAHLFNLRKEKRHLQICVEDYFRKQTLVRYTLLAEGEHKQQLIAITHAHFATRSTAEFLAGWKQESGENLHPLTDAIDKAIRAAKDAVSSGPTEKSSS